MSKNTINEPLISIGDVLSILRYRWLPGLAVGLVLAASVGLFMMSPDPIYQASTSVMVETNPDRVLNNMEDVVDQHNRNLNITINTHKERLQSRQIATAVADNLSEAQISALIAPYIDPENPEQRPNPIAIISNAFSVSSDGNSTVLMLSATHPDPQVAAQVANQYATTYIRYLSSMRAGSSEVAVTFLEEQVAAAQAEVQVGEKALQDFRRDNNLVSIEENQTVVSQELQGLNEALNQLQIRLVTLRSQVDQIEGAGTDPDALARIPALTENESFERLVHELEELKQERDILSRKYLRKHPDMVANANRQEAALRQLAAAADRQRATLEETRNGIQTEIGILNERVADAEERARGLDRLSIQYTVREREVESKRRTYERLIDRLNETLVTSRLNTTVLRVMDEARPPSRPISPSIRKSVMAAGVVFILCLVGIPLGLEFMDNRVRTFADVELILKKPLLGDIREIKESSTQAITRGVIESNEEIYETFRTIYSSLHLNENLPPKLALLITSTIPSEGKSFVAANLGEIYARHGRKVLLVDTDLRRPSLARYLEQSNEKGLLSWIRKRREQNQPGNESPVADFGDLTILPITANLDLLPAGGSTKSPTEFLTSSELDLLVSHLKEHYDLIIFDTPPAGIFPDASLLADYVDGSIYVIRQKKVVRAAARHSIEMLDKSHAPVAGVVLNGVTSNPTAGRGDYGGYGGYGGYGYKYGGYSYKYAYRKKYQSEYNEADNEADK